MKIGHFLRWAKVLTLLNLSVWTIQPGPPPTIRVRNALQAVEATLAYLREHHARQMLSEDARWQERTLYPQEHQDMALTSKLFTSGDLKVEVFQRVAPLHATVYQVTAFSPKPRWYWKGSINADGTVTEATAFAPLTEEEAEKITAEFLHRSEVPAPKMGGYGH